MRCFLLKDFLATELPLKIVVLLVRYDQIPSVETVATFVGHDVSGEPQSVFWRI